MKQPQLSVVIIGRNEGQRLIDCIRSVQAINEPKDSVEIIYVDSDSTDGSPAEAEALGAKVLIVHPERPAAAIGRNAGWRVAQAPLVLFLDGDTILHPDFVKKAIQVLDDPQVAIVWGHRRELAPYASVYQRVLDLDWVYPPGNSEFCGGDALMRRAVLEEVDGYNPQLIAGEEPEMCQRIRTLGYTIRHIDEPMTEHDLAITQAKQYWQRAVRAGHAYAEVASLFWNTTSPLWQSEVRKTFWKATLLSGIFVLGSLAGLVLQAWWPLVLSVCLFLLLSVRTAIKTRWKSGNLLTLLLYGLHSQFQCLPIAIGQLSYYYHHWRGQRRRLIEYK
jgi:cellulose synthase/poly-beta-1,6-N-acetylglucosamine synthase-like glycosyltransferase